MPRSNLHGVQLGDKSYITLGEFQKQFTNRLWAGEGDEDQVWFALILLLLKVLLGCPDKIMVDCKWLQLAEDLPLFDKYP